MGARTLSWSHALQLSCNLLDTKSPLARRRWRQRRSGRQQSRTHPVGAEVAEAEDPRAVSGDDDLVGSTSGILFFCCTRLPQHMGRCVQSNR